MKLNYFVLSIISATIIIAVSQTVQAQTTVNFTKLFEDKFSRPYTTTVTDLPTLALAGQLNNSTVYTGLKVIGSVQDVEVKYDSPTTILIGGDLITKDHLFNSGLWQGVDMLKNQYGFKLQQVMTNGVGSEESPSTVYILMTK